MRKVFSIYRNPGLQRTLHVLKNLAIFQPSLFRKPDGLIVRMPVPPLMFSSHVDLDTSVLLAPPGQSQASFQKVFRASVLAMPP